MSRPAWRGLFTSAALLVCLTVELVGCAIAAEKGQTENVILIKTDHWGHAGRYDRLLQSAHKVDDYVRRLWEFTQATPQYRDKTTILMTADHGRGVAPENWKHHGEKVEGAENIWMAFLGPDTPALGERTDCAAVTQSQVAATLAALLGEDYQKQVPQAGKPVADALPRGK